MTKEQIAETISGMVDLIESDLPLPEEEVILRAALRPLWAIYDRMEEEE